MASGMEGCTLLPIHLLTLVQKECFDLCRKNIWLHKGFCQKRNVSASFLGDFYVSLVIKYLAFDIYMFRSRARIFENICSASDVQLITY